jgi:hypothetical protein
MAPDGFQSEVGEIELRQAHQYQTISPEQDKIPRGLCPSSEKPALSLYSPKLGLISFPRSGASLPFGEFESK